MKYRPLGDTGLHVSTIGLGCASYWGKRRFDEGEAIRLVHAAVAEGVTFFDTGSSYSDGNAEPRLGKALAGVLNRHKLVVATKAGTRIGHGGRLFKDFSPDWIRASVEESLTRLGFDRLPLLQLHGPQIADLTDDLRDTLARLQTEGKVHALGVNSFDMKVISHVATCAPFQVAMIDYNLLRPERAPIIQQLAAQKFGVLAGMALAGGLCSAERYRIRDWRDVWYVARILKNHRADALRGRHFGFINHQPGWTGGQIALAWVLKNPEVNCAVLGTTRLDHLRANLAAADRVLEPTLLRMIEEAPRRFT